MVSVILYINSRNTGSEIRFTSLSQNDVITSPLIISGTASGSWFFEGTFPVTLYDQEGAVISRSFSQAQSDWMTEEMVAFTFELMFEPPATALGMIILNADNPSGLKEFEKQVMVPIRFFLPGTTSKHTLETFDGTRDYRVHVPNKDMLAEEMDLLVVLHSGSGSAREAEASLGFNYFADTKGFIVAYPDGVEKHWNDGRGVTQDVDDVEYISNLVEELKSTYPISEVYVAGISNGAMMTYRLACESNAVFNGIAMVIGNVAEPIFETCNTANPLPAIVINSSNDPFVFQEGGTCCQIYGFGLGGELVSTQRSLALLQKKNGCTDQNTELFEDIVQDGTYVKKIHYTCDTPLVYYEIIGGGHTWPPLAPFLKVQGVSSQNDLRYSFLL